MIDLNKLSEAFDHRTGTVLDGKRVLFEAAEKVIALRAELEEQENRLIANGIEGKNAEERKANLKAAFSGRRLELENAEAAERKARYFLDCFQTELDGLRYRLRVAELMSKESEK
jgi:ABC-type phosphate transport system auxiliary subunit